MKRYILPLDVWDKRQDKIVRMIGKSRKEGRSWSGEVSQKEMRRLVISGNHYIRQGYSAGFEMQGVAKLWVNETGKNWPLDLLIKPPPF